VARPASPQNAVVNKPIRDALPTAPGTRSRLTDHYSKRYTHRSYAPSQNSKSGTTSSNELERIGRNHCLGKEKQNQSIKQAGEPWRQTMEDG